MVVVLGAGIVALTLGLAALALQAPCGDGGSSDHFCYFYQGRGLGHMMTCTSNLSQGQNPIRLVLCKLQIATHWWVLKSI